MANDTPSYTPQQAISLVQNIAHGIPLTAVQANICDMVNSIMWHYYPWSWTVESLTPFNLSNGVQDYVNTGAFITIPITLNASTTPINYGGGYPISTAPGSLTESSSTVTVITSYAHNLPTGATLAGTVCTISGVTTPNTGYNGSLTITTVPNSTTIVGTVGATGLSSAAAPGVTDILRPLKLRIVRCDVSPNEFRELMLLNNLSPELTRTGGIDTMKAIVLYSSTNTFRFDLAANIGTNQIVQLQGEYQFNPARITDATMNSPLPFPDRYFNVFVEGVAWQVYRLSDDSRAGMIQLAKNGTSMKQYTGQLGSFMEALMTMSRTEDLGSGDEFQWPDSPLGVGRSYWPGLYGI